MPLLYFLLPVAWSKWDWNILPGEYGVWRDYLGFATGDVSSLLEDRQNKHVKVFFLAVVSCPVSGLEESTFFFLSRVALAVSLPIQMKIVLISWVIIIYKHFDCVEQVILTTSYQNHDEGTIILESGTTKLHTYICTK